MIIRRSINKEEVKDMPKAVFPGQIHVVQTPQEAERAVAYLKKMLHTGYRQRNASVIHQRAVA